MGAIWAVISLLAVWLIYGLIASIFVKGVTSRDGLKLIFAGMLGGYLVVKLEYLWMFLKIYGG